MPPGRRTTRRGRGGAWMGTRFVVSHEWGGPSSEQEAVLAATAHDTVLTRLYGLIGARRFCAGNPDRMMRNAVIDRWNGRKSRIPSHREPLHAEVAAAHERADLSVAGIHVGGAIRAAICLARPDTANWRYLSSAPNCSRACRADLRL